MVVSLRGSSAWYLCCPLHDNAQACAAPVTLSQATSSGRKPPGMPVGQRTGTCPFAAGEQPAGAEVFSNVWGRDRHASRALSLWEGRPHVVEAAGWGWRELFDKPWLFLLPTFLPNAFGPWRLLRELIWGPACSSRVQVPHCLCPALGSCPLTPSHLV